MTPLDTLRSKLASCGTVFGTSITLADVVVSEVIASAGFDFVWIDMEHTALQNRDVLMHLIAARSVGLTSFVRVPRNSVEVLKSILDMGPDGIIVPNLRSLAEVTATVDLCRYPPAGNRGFGPIRAAGYGRYGTTDYISEAEDRFMLMFQVEHVNLIRDIVKIVTLPKVDGLIVGPMDLSGSVGKLGQVRDPEVLGMMDEIANAVAESRVPLGVSFGYNSADAADWVRRGARFISMGIDVDYIKQSAGATLMEARRMLESAGS